MEVIFGYPALWVWLGIFEKLPFFQGLDRTYAYLMALPLAIAVHFFVAMKFVTVQVRE